MPQTYRHVLECLIPKLLTDARIRKRIRIHKEKIVVDRKSRLCRFKEMSIKEEMSWWNNNKKNNIVIKLFFSWSKLKME